MRIEKTDSTPLIVMDDDQNYLLFSGESRPENARDFYEGVVLWLDSYGYKLRARKKSTVITCDFKLNYFNSSSAKYVFDTIEKLKTISEELKHVSLVISWYHDALDEDMVEAGREFEKLTDIKLVFKTNEEE